MKYIETLQNVLTAITADKANKEAELVKLEEDFANVKLNPYGITSIDFSKRQELTTDILKIEGTMMGLQLAIETYEEQQGATA